MIGLHADAEHAALAHGVAAARDVANFGRGKNQVLVAHDFGDGGGNLGSDGPLQTLQVGVGGCVVENEFAELADRQAPDRAGRPSSSKVSAIRRLTSSSSGSISGCWTIVAERKIGEFALGRHPLPLRARGQSRQLVAGLLFVRLGKQLAQIAKRKPFGHIGAKRSHLGWRLQLSGLFERERGGAGLRRTISASVYLSRKRLCETGCFPR